jgi:hypothetical protein
MRWLEYLPSHWQRNVDKYLSRPEAEYRQISLADLLNDLRITFEDDSTAYFYYAFYLSDPETKEVAVFTEHCGYHVFPYFIKSLETINRQGEVVRSESFF